MSKKLDQEIDELLDILPSDEEIKEETRKEKISKWSLGKKKPNVGKKISESYRTTPGRAVQAAKSKPHTEDAKKKIADANTGLVKGPEIRAKLSVKKIGNNHRARPIVTPLGIFPSRKDAAEAYLASGKANALRWIEKWLKTDPNDFYYISKEEYIMLTGKDI
jgi:hypothetical protein